ncbi:MAG: DUF4010 domain-containing protein [Candidatus Macondimonas sp.]|jgi:uncharacterized membrane protein (DUF4010 family)
MALEGQAFGNLALALAVGLLIGLERGWQSRTLAEGERIAGLRTFGLLGLLGGVASLLSEAFGGGILVAMILAVAAVLGGAYLLRFESTEAASATTTIAALLTLGFGALAGVGELELAAAGAVTTSLVLNLKPTLHAGLQRLEANELQATLNLLLISVVLLPVLPDRGYGPWEVFNPYRLWWMVVLIAGISFGGYFAVKLLGPGRGIPLTGLLGGLSSSTAVTLNLARLARSHPDWSPTLASGILVACGTMFPRILLVSGLLYPPLLMQLAPPLAAMALVTYAGAGVFWWLQRRAADQSADLPLSNPFQLGMALRFGALLAGILLAAEWIRSLWGEQGLYVLAMISGLTDVDAITLSLARMGREGLALNTVVWGVLLAAMTNNLVKAGLAVGLGGRAVGSRVSITLMGASLLGLAVEYALATS